MNDIERRTCEDQFRFLPAPADQADAGLGTLTGYAAVFNRRSAPLGGGSRRFVEQITPGAFSSALAAGDNVMAYYHHGFSGGIPGETMPLGTTRSGSLQLREDAHGLLFDLKLPNTQQARDMVELIKRGDIRGASFGMATNPPVRDSWARDGGMMVRTVHEVGRLIDVSPTHRPAYEDTALALRSLDAWQSAHPDAAADVRGMRPDGSLSFERQDRIIRAALEESLGKSWETPGWDIVATFADEVIIESAGAMSSYPLTWSKQAVTLGKAQPVDQVFAPSPVAPAPPAQASASSGASSRANRLRLAEAETSIGLDNRV